MSTSHLVCLCACFCLPLANPVDYFSPQQVSQWRTYIDHTNWPGPNSQTSRSERSYSYRTDWTGHQHQRSSVTQQKVYSRQAARHSETGFGFPTPLLGPLSYQTNSDDQVQSQVLITNRQLDNHQNLDPYVNPAPGIWAQHYSRENSGVPFSSAIPTFPQVQPFELGSHDTYRYTVPDQEPLVHPQPRYLYKENPSSPNTYSKPLTKQSNVKLRTTQESYFGKDSFPEQSNINHRYVEPPSPQNQDDDEQNYDKLIKQIEWLKAKRVSPQIRQEPFVGQSQLNSHLNFNLLSAWNELINHYSKFPEQSSSKPHVLYSTIPRVEISSKVLNPQFGSIAENVNWFKPYISNVPGSTNESPQQETFTPHSDIPTDILSPVVQVPNSVDIQNKTLFSFQERTTPPINKSKNFSLNDHIEVAVSRFDTEPISQTNIFSNTFQNQIGGLTVDEESAGIHIQPSGAGHEGQWESCEGPVGYKGKCVPVELCDLEDSYHHYSRTQQYYCINRHKQAIGICCVNVKSSDPLAGHADAASPDLQEIKGSSITDVQLPEQPDHDLHHPHHHNEHCIYPIADYKVCGKSGKMMSNITKRAVASVRDWPWTAVLVFRSTLSQFCGGTLITRRHVLTAAHCFRIINPDDILVLLGDYDVRQSNESSSRAFAVERLISNDDYDPASHENDIALLVLNTTTVYNNYIQPACLPAPGPRYTNETAVITGWGRIQYRGQLPTNLMEVPLPVWDQDICIPRFAQTIFDTHMCAGAFEGGRDSCQGDSGGPLVKQCHHSQRWIIIGVVSWGIRCGERDKPGIYTRVNEYLDWIHENIIDNSTVTTETTTVDMSLPVHRFI